MAQISGLELVRKEFKNVFKAHKEPIDRTMDKKLIINIAPVGAFADRTINPHIPYTTEEVTREVGASWNAGASIFHLHPRDPETGFSQMPLEKRIKIHKEWCDSVFQVAPDIITDAGGLYVVPPAFIPGTSLIDEKSILAETRMAPLVDNLVKLGPNNRYIEIGISLVFAAAIGGRNILGFNPQAGAVSDVKYFQSKGIKVELSPFHHVDLQDVKEWLIDSGVAKLPVILSTVTGVHNSPTPRTGMESYEFLFTYVRMLPKGVLWQAVHAGRYWLPLTAAAIALGCDIVRVGMEDSVYMYPHKNDYIQDNAKAIEAVAQIARYFGREVATPSETREILGLPQISKR